MPSKAQSSCATSDATSRLPTNVIADAVDDVEEALLVLAHQVTGPNPGVARCEYMAQDSLLGLGRTGVALEPAAGVRRIVLHLADRLAGLVDAAANTETVLVAYRLAFVEVEGDQRGREAVRQMGECGRWLRACPAR